MAAKEQSPRSQRGATGDPMTVRNTALTVTVSFPALCHFSLSRSSGIAVSQPTTPKWVT